MTRMASLAAFALFACGTDVPRATCNDHQKNGAESDVDCGGGVCPACANGLSCRANADCASSTCVAGRCAAAPSCTDQIKNGTETDVDCGGTCPACGDGKSCAAATDCTSGYCNAAHACASKCTDGLKDGPETDVDCGGGTCPACGDGKGCAAATDCTSGYCNAAHACASKCTDGLKDGLETDVDCGGGTCPACAAGRACAVPADCATALCTGGVCRAAHCANSLKDADETDVDCGGSCAGCALHRGCAIDGDCLSGHCVGNSCSQYVASCSDGVKDGTETDVDCGGSACAPCSEGLACAAGSDCASGVCGPGGICNAVAPASTVQTAVVGALRDPAGSLHVFQAEGLYSVSCPGFTSLTDSVLKAGAWTKTTVYTPAAPDYVGGFSPVVTSKGELVVLFSTSQYCSGARGQEHAFIAINNGAGWSAYQADTAAGPLVNGAGTEYESGGGFALTIDANDTLHALVSTYGGTPGNAMTYYQWTLGTDGKPVNNAGHSPQVLQPAVSGAPAIFVDLDGQVHAAWHNYSSGPLTYRTSTDGGNTFSAAEPFSTKASVDYAISLAVLGTGATKAVYVEHSNGSGLEIDRRNSAGWGATADLADSTAGGGFLNPELHVVGGALRAFFVAPVTAGGPAQLQVRTHGASAWGAATNLDGNPAWGNRAYAVADSTWPAADRAGATVPVAKTWQSQSSPSRYLLLLDSN